MGRRLHVLVMMIGLLALLGCASAEQPAAVPSPEAGLTTPTTSEPTASEPTTPTTSEPTTPTTSEPTTPTTSEPTTPTTSEPTTPTTTSEPTTPTDDSDDQTPGQLSNPTTADPNSTEKPDAVTLTPSGSVVIAPGSLELCPVQRADDLSGLIWQGFTHTWERRVAGFQTPHRISGLGAFVDDESVELGADTWNTTATAKFLFSPGVDGDKSQPTLSYRGVVNDQIRVRRGSVRFDFTDTATSGDAPEATTTLTQTFDVDTNCLGLGSELNYAVVLRGFRLKSQCDDAKQPKSNPCNSDGMWAHKLSGAITGCTLLENQSTLRCTATIEVFRSWTPSEGGGKPFNDRLDVTFVLHYTAIFGKPEQFNPVTLPKVSGRSDIHSDPVTVSLEVDGKPGFTRAVTGVTAFSYQLLKTNGHDRLGRYMTSLQFGVTDQSYDETSGLAKIQATMGFGAPSTVYKSDIRYALQGTLLQFGAGSRAYHRRSVSGQVCVSGFAFSCDKQELTERTSHAVPFDVIPGS